MTVRYEPSGGAVVRAPVLPFDRLRWVLENVDQRLPVLVRDPLVREAIAVASSSLSERVDRWLAGDQRDAAGVVRAVLSYVTRMATRPTPFGLFASCAAGSLGASTTLQLAGTDGLQRRTRVDFGVLTGVVDRLEADRDVRSHLRYRPNTALCRAGGRLRLAERRVDGAAVRYHRVVVEEDEAVSAALAAAVGAEGGAEGDNHGDGAPIAALAAAVADACVDDDISLDDATDFVHDLIDAQVLVSTLGPPITGSDATGHVIDALRSAAPAATRALADVRDRLDALDAGGLGQDPAAYDAVAAGLAPLGVAVARERLLQVDVTEPGEGIVIGTKVVQELMRGAELLHRLSAAPSSAGDMGDFCRAFTERYGDTEVPLGEALDEEVGVGFGGPAGPAVEGAPLLDGLDRPPPTRAEAFTGQDAIRLRLLSQALAAGADEIVLSAADIEALTPAERDPLPDAAAVTATVLASSSAAVDRGEFRLLVSSVTGPSGARVLGRFALADKGIAAVVAAHLTAEEALDADAVYAEVVHLPEGRTGNVLSRPVLRSYEIPFSGMSGAPAERQLTIDDLLVRVVGDRAVLRSRRLGRVVRPRMSTAHNHQRSALAPYRFLVSLAYADVTSTARWSWGPLDAAPFLPRVAAGRMILSRARWTLTVEETAGLAAAVDAGERSQEVDRLRHRRRLPDWVVVAVADHELPVDLTTEAGRDLLAHEARKGTLVLREMLPGPSDLLACRPGGAVTHELVLPIVRAEAHPPRLRLPAVSREPSHRFPPGSPWMSLHLPTGRATADQLLRDAVAPVIAHLRQSGVADRWFFVRYNDPTGWHLRVRLHGDPARLSGALPEISSAWRLALDDGRLADVELHTYEREVDRYGGELAIESAEELFMADSDAALRILALTPGDAGLDVRWQVGLAGADWLLSDLGFDAGTRAAAFVAARDTLAAEQGATGKALRRLAGDRYRTHRGVLAALLNGEAGEPDGTDGTDGTGSSAARRAALGALRQRSEAGAAAVARLQTLERQGQLSRSLLDIGLSLVHMHLNRLLRGAPRHQELVVCDLLARLHAARARNQSRP